MIRARQLMVVMFVAWGLICSSPSPAKTLTGVRGLFDVSQELFAAHKYAEAASSFERLLKRYPGYEPAQIQLAKCYYRLEKSREAYNIFKSLDYKNFDQETTYEYAWTFYNNKNWEGALAAFRAINKGHALYDFANYYGGICAIKLKHYDDAEAMLDQAVVLPDKLAKSRTMYVKHVQSILLIQQNNQLAKERESLAKPNKHKKSPVATKSAPVKPAPAPPAAPPEYQGFMGTGKSASITYFNDHQSIDYSGSKLKTFDASVGQFNLSTTPHLLLPFKQSKDRFGAIGIGISLGAESRITKGQEQQILVDQKDQFIERHLTNTLPTKDEKSGNFAINPWIELPLALNFWNAYGLNLSFNYPEFERGQRTGTQELFASLGGKHEHWSYGLTAYHKNLVNPKNQATAVINGLNVSGAYDWPSQLTVSAIGTYEASDYPVAEAQIEGPDSLLKGELDVVQSFPMGFSIRVSGVIDQQTNAIFYNIPTYGVVSANGITYTGLGSIVYGSVPGGPRYPGRSGRTPKILEFFDAAITVVAKNTVWKVNERDTEEVFKLAQPDYVEQVTGTINVSLSF